MKNTIFTKTRTGLKPVKDVQLKVNQIFFLNGYGQDEHHHERKAVYEITSSSFDGKNQYKWVNLDKPEKGIKNAWEIKPISEKFGIGSYYNDNDPEFAPPDEVAGALIKANKAEKVRNEKAEKNRKEGEKREKKGKEIFEKLCPAWAKAAIVAIYEIDESDGMTDYFSTKDGRVVLLGWSKHTKDIFSEMRKHAGNFEETEHLATPSNIDCNGKSPDYEFYQGNQEEHREKYSMGAGYYLKNGSRYSTGWKIEKINLSYEKHKLIHTMWKPENIKLKTESKQVKQVNGTATTQPGKIELIEYSEKAIALKGNTFEVKDIIQSLGGKFNRFLKDKDGTQFIGWILPKTKEAEVRQALNL